MWAARGANRSPAPMHPIEFPVMLSSSFERLI